jgi:hypothetical protein
MKRLLTLTSALAIMGVAAPAAHAGAQQGVKCPSGFAATISDGNRKLVCVKTVRYELASICSPVQISFQGTVTTKPQVVMEPSGSDQCLAVLSGVKTASLMSPPAPGQPAPSEFARVINATAPDKFVATRTEYAFPEGTMYGPGDARNGVSCPSGYDGDKVFNDRGIRCDKLDGSPKPADCDGIAAGPVALGWRWERDHVGSEDRCVPMGTGEHGPTKPQGMTKAQHDLERASDDIGWVLDKNAGARDTWQRKVYKFPNRN